MDSRLLELNRRGVFPGPKESDLEFFLRAESLAPIAASSHLIETKFESIPDWIETFVQSKGLFPWEAAATWIEEKSEGVRTCRVQLKKSFLTSLYVHEEVVAHEMVHAMRLMFDESGFEEILAYQTSKNRFRRYFGPLFSSPKESRFVIILAALSWFTYLAEGIFDFSLGGEYILLAPLFALGFGCLRLRRSQRIFSAALRNLEKATGAGLAVALHLTDEEIKLFAKSTPEEICAFAKKEQSLRWRQLDICYFGGLYTPQKKIENRPK